MSKQAIIIGAGPAGLTAAYELLKRTDITPIILEKSGDIGGISKTVNYKGNRIDIGGHRFFSKSDRVMNWWCNIMPVQSDQGGSVNISYQNKSRKIDTASSGTTIGAGKDPDKVMLVRKRLSRIYFLRKFFTYPIQLSFDTLRKLGVSTTITIMLSYLKAQVFPRKPEKSLQDFMINRFGSTLYKLFFKDYTEKVWGVPCEKIPAQWGAQRIKGVSIGKAIKHAIKTATISKGGDIAQKDTETSLIEQFLYPKYGPGQLWEEVARHVEQMGGKILLHHDVKQIYTGDNRVIAVAAINNVTGETSYLEGDYFFSTMPVQELIGGMDGPIPDDVKHVASGLQYRDFITVGILLQRMSFLDRDSGEWKPLQLNDTWIYIQEKDVKVGRLQIFNNWSPFMVKDPATVWVGMEFFCNKEDEFWQKPDVAIEQLAIGELEKIGLASRSNVLDATVIRMEKTYPAYFGTYEQFDVVRNFVDSFENLFLVGRNGMHKYNNSDHSMLTAMVAVDNISAGSTKKGNIWAINTEQEYCEEKRTTKDDKRKLPQQNKIQSITNEKQERAGNLILFLEEQNIFFKYIYRHNVYFLIILSALAVAQFLIFKKLYPFGNYMPDSYGYIGAAGSNDNISTWPIGYSKFLRVFSAFTHSDIALVLVQYLILQASTSYFAFTLFYHMRARRLVIYVVITCLCMNPLLLYVSNYVSSDALFISISLLWASQLVWIRIGSSHFHLWLHAFVLLFAFSLRYSALYYPIISIGVILLSKCPIGIRIKSITLSAVLIFLFIWHTGNQYKSLTGVRQFSPFGGWQLASNALYMYAHTFETYHSPLPKALKALDHRTRAHLDSLKHIRHRPDSVLGIYYLWGERSPLNTYMEHEKENGSALSEFKAWARVGPLYTEYGKVLVKEKPWQFAKYFVLPNVRNYLLPPIEFLGVYNMERDTVDLMAKQWFHYPTNKIRSLGDDRKILVLNWAYIINALVNAAFLLSVIGFIVVSAAKTAANSFIQPLFLIALIWIVHFLFSILAAPIVMRYQIFILTMCFPLSVIVIDFIARIEDSQGVGKQIQHTD